MSQFASFHNTMLQAPSAKQHLCEEQFPPPTVKNLLIDNIFGFTNPDGTYHEELVYTRDAQTLDAQLDNLKDKWDCSEHQAFTDHKSHNPGFHLCRFSCFKTEYFCQCTLRTLREDIGHGCPPGKILGVAVLQNHFIQMTVSPLMLT